MDLRIYYNKIREQEAKIAEQFPIIVSAETPEGGKAGVKTEVPRRIAAKMIIDGLARLAQDTEAVEFLEEREAAIRTAKEAAEAARVQVNIITSSAMERLKGTTERPAE